MRFHSDIGETARYRRLLESECRRLAIEAPSPSPRELRYIAEDSWLLIQCELAGIDPSEVRLYVH